MILSQKNVDASPGGIEPPDDELIAGAQAGGEEVFIRLIERYRPLLWRIAYRMAPDRDDAWDICQEIVIRVWRAMPRFRPGEPLAPWLRVIAVREALRWLRRYRNGPIIIQLETIEESLPSPAGPLALALERLSAEDDQRRLGAALAELSPQQRTAVTLRFYEDMALSEIAEAMECSEGSVKQHLFRAMEKMRQSLRNAECGMRNAECGKKCPEGERNP